MKKVNICTLSENETVLFAANELKKYLRLLNENIVANITLGNTDDAEGIAVGLWDEETTDVDTTVVDIDGLEGKILGSNPRSVLFAVYQYLEALGVRWVRHGADGEYIPAEHDFSEDSIHFEHTAKQKHRAMMIEGALSLEISLDNIDWCAKMGFNQYYIQYENPKFFYKHWYEHQFNPYLEKEILSDDDYREIKNKMIREIKKRGMLLHDVGHGWHSNPFGFPSKPEDLTPEQRNLLAELSGKRDYYVKRSITSTHLCYSQEYVRKTIVDYVVNYCRNHPEVDFLCFPLADGSSNHCECEECLKYRPSDYYVMLLNDVDAALTANRFDQKLCVAIYCDFLWKPEKFKFNNPDRFLYCYAPYHKLNNKSYKQLDLSDYSIPAYVRNKVAMPEDVEGLISHLKSWQDWQFVEGFAHEYYYYAGEHYFDYGSIFLANIVYEDIQCLGKLGLCGMMSCQSQRSFMPTGLGSYVMAKCLWDDSIAFNDLKKEYFDAAFGKYSDVFNKYFTYLSDITHEGDKVPFDKVIYAANQMSEYIKGIDLEALDNSTACSIKYIAFHCGLLVKESIARESERDNGFENTKELWLEVIDYVRKHELEVQPAFDLYQYFTHLRQRINPEIKSLYSDDYDKNITAAQNILLQ